MSEKKLPAWFCILLWISLGISMIIFNKALLSSWNFGFPFFLTAWHCIFATIITQILSRVFPNLFPGVQSGKVDTKVGRMIVLMSLFFAAGLVLGNSAYKYISLAYIQMLKSMNPVVLLPVQFMVGRESPSVLQLSIVLLISLGVSMSSVGELNFSLVGFTLQVRHCF